ncbi:MAG: hypothetical protein LBS54_04435 [Dysgonamonadaceae bacterium]|jgi:hypothetical protein|nr:hypothetical protein [Dysgonamonadaceae bacterium]
MTNLNNFLAHTHQYSPSLKLEGQKIFPNWIKTLKQGTTTPIQEINRSFYRMFYCSTPPFASDTSEPKFQDNTVLSSLGPPLNPPNKQTYTGRSGFDPINTGWY